MALINGEDSSAWLRFAVLVCTHGMVYLLYVYNTIDDEM